MAISPITGAEIDVIRRRIADMKRKATPMKWSQRNMMGEVGVC